MHCPNFYKILIRPLLFQFEAEVVHNFMHRNMLRFLSIRWVKGLVTKFYRVPSRPVHIGPLTFANAVGLAAGFDKNGDLACVMDSFGFGFLEVGTVTPLAQPGNSLPRLFRIPEQEAILNRMGFNNLGCDALEKNLLMAKKTSQIPIGINLGKNKDTPNDKATEDYAQLMRKLRYIADYFVINISSPNTPGLRGLQNITFLQELGNTIISLGALPPVFVKLSPVLPEDEWTQILQHIHQNKAYFGLILTNTIPTDLGGISGKPLTELALKKLKEARSYLGPKIPIISVGGIFSPEEAQRRIAAGANAVQLYTGFIYEGPSLIKKIVNILNLPR